MDLSGSDQRPRTNSTRREILQVGYSGLLGVGLSALPRFGVAAPASRVSTTPKSVILVFLTGGPSHIDMFDMKPDAPDEVRGEFQPIATRTSGLGICEHLPLLASRSNKYALVQSLAHGDNRHFASTHHFLTGQKQIVETQESREAWPCYAAALDYLRPREDGIPSGVHLPVHLTEGPLTWPGQHGGFLGPRHDPWQIRRDPNAADFHVEGLRLMSGVDQSRLESRRALLDQINRQQQGLDALATSGRLQGNQSQAFSILTSSGISRAFDLESEPVSIRDQYGRHTFGQSLLLARRLVQAGVPIVQANMGNAQTWDTHGDGFSRLKNGLLPPLDQAVAALLDDLEATGLIDETLVMVLGEFGRTPKISLPPQANAGLQPGRDHWAGCFSGLFVGAGVRGGQVIGRSDQIGAYPTTTPFTPDDVGATVFHMLGIEPEAEIRDRLGRPAQLNRGQVMQSLWTG